MPLSAGDKLGPYEILGPLGAGGMGEVYKATDTKLDREVAIKVLPDAFADDPERLARFEREAKVLASLNHSSIAQIYGVEGRALVMELVPGRTLAERIAAGPVPVEEALRIAAQIAEALAAAHERGVIHRDLKPANVKVMPDGRVKVLDGLAKLLSKSGAETDSRDETLTAAMTQAGSVVGMPGYVSPEQARGSAVDKRTDIWALGCVLYELLTRRRAFRGETLNDTIAAVLEREPDWDILPPTTPPKVCDLLRRCLRKDVRRRARDAGDIAIEIEEALAAPAEGERKATPVVQSRFQEGEAVFSPDGRWLAYVSNESGEAEVYVQKFPGPGGKLQVSSQGGTEPVWARKGRELFYRNGDKMMAVDIEAAPVFKVSTPRALFEGKYNTTTFLQSYDISADGQRFLMIKSGGAATPVTQFNAVLNWVADVKRRASAK